MVMQKMDISGVPYHSFVLIKFLIILFTNIIFETIIILLDRPMVMASKNHLITSSIKILLKILLLILLFFKFYNISI